LKANVKEYAKDAFVFQIEGQPKASHFLHEYVKERSGTPLLVDILSCEGGCNIGSGTCLKEGDFYAVGKVMQGVENDSKKGAQKDWDNGLILDDFLRKYTPRKVAQIFVDKHELEEAFVLMKKPSHGDRTTDCRACGYSCCQKMAVAIAKGINHEENCLDYLKNALKAKGGGK
jgi:hypothetical protein